MKTLKEHRFYTVSISSDKEKVLRFEWLPETSNMKDQDFKDALTDVADLAIAHKVSYLLVDVREFKHRFEDPASTMAWRTQYILPKYKKAGIRKEAFFMPEGASKITANHGDMETDSFSSEKDIKNWFAN